MIMEMDYSLMKVMVEILVSENIPIQSEEYRDRMWLHTDYIRCSMSFIYQLRECIDSPRCI